MEGGGGVNKHAIIVRHNYFLNTFFYSECVEHDGQ
jgi:hypothetical protein